MRSSKDSFKWVIIAAFALAAGLTTYLLFQLPDLIPQYSSELDLTVVKQLDPLLYQVYAAVGVTILLGSGAIALIVSSGSVQVSQIAEYRISDQSKTQSEAEAQEDNNDDFHLGKVEDILSSETDVEAVFNQALSQVCNTLEASQGAVYRTVEEENSKTIELFATYAYHIPEGDKVTFRWGEGLVGQSAKEEKVFNINTVPEGYIQIFSGLGKATPKHLLIVPIKDEGDTVVGMLELSSFKPFLDNHILAAERYFGKLALKLTNNDNVSLKAAKL